MCAQNPKSACASWLPLFHGRDATLIDSVISISRRCSFPLGSPPSFAWCAWSPQTPRCMPPVLCRQETLLCILEDTTDPAVKLVQVQEKQSTAKLQWMDQHFWWVLHRSILSFCRLSFGIRIGKLYMHGFNSNVKTLMSSRFSVSSQACWAVNPLDKQTSLDAQF